MKDTKDASLIEVTESFYGKRPLKETYADELLGRITWIVTSLSER